MLRNASNLAKRRILSPALATMFMVAGARSLGAAELDAKVCSNATLHGAFPFTQTGTLDGLPFAVVGRVTFDGRGSFQSVATIRIAKNFSNFESEGSYAVNPDCTGSETVSATGETLDFVIVRNGTEVQAINPAPKPAMVAKEQSRKHPDSK